MWTTKQEKLSRVTTRDHNIMFSANWKENNWGIYLSSSSWFGRKVPNFQIHNFEISNINRTQSNSLNRRPFSVISNYESFNLEKNYSTIRHNFDKVKNSNTNAKLYSQLGWFTVQMNLTTRKIWFQVLAILLEKLKQIFGNIKMFAKSFEETFQCFHPNPYSSVLSLT